MYAHLPSGTNRINFISTESRWVSGERNNQAMVFENIDFGLKKDKLTAWM